jgi:hypothetical protein
MSSNGDSVSTPSKVLIICCSLVAGLISALIITVLTQAALLFFPVWIVVSLAYPFIGAVIIPVCDDFRLWAHQGKAERWTRDDVAGLAAFWPIVLVGCLIYYTFLGIVNRLY